MDASLYVSSPDDDLQQCLNIGAKILWRWSSSRIMTPSTPVKRPRPGWKTMFLRSWHGLLNQLISIPLRICGITSRGSLESVRNCHGTTSLPLLQSPLAASDPIHLCSAPSSSTPQPLSWYNLPSPPPITSGHL